MNNTVKVPKFEIGDKVAFVSIAAFLDDKAGLWRQLDLVRIEAGTVYEREWSENSREWKYAVSLPGGSGICNIQEHLMMLVSEVASRSENSSIRGQG